MAFPARRLTAREKPPPAPAAIDHLLADLSERTHKVAMTLRPSGYLVFFLSFPERDLKRRSILLFSAVYARVRFFSCADSTCATGYVWIFVHAHDGFCIHLSDL